MYIIKFNVYTLNSLYYLIFLRPEREWSKWIIDIKLFG